ncbi:hypothetical protein [Vibrio alginolyticus]|uniref:hypothetical protein n=1 Tax=Vibrio alginolyticus TaxID=663 RepID=UPI002554727B|nr:hypothetical protein [Vibrio alginolyticus]MDL0445804.1 hypothetical protein [Vibrio alginolyticus]
MKFKISLLCSLVAFSASTLAADDTKTYYVALTADIPSELSFQLVDGSGDELIGAQYQPLVAGVEPVSGKPILYSNGLVDGYKLTSNDQGVTFKVTRTLSPLTHPSDLNNAVWKSSFRVETAASDCTEQLEWASSASLINQSLDLVSYVQNNTILCPTNVKFLLYGDISQVPAGAYSAILTIDVEPNL